MNVELMEMIEADGSRLAKEYLLARERDTRFLVWALDPMVTFGVTVDEDMLIGEWERAGRAQHDEVGPWWDWVDASLRLMSVRELSGNAALGRIVGLVLAAPGRLHVKWLCRVLNKNLRCGVQVSTANKVFADLITPFQVALAKPYVPDKHDLRGRWIIEPKLDGLRMVVLDGRAYTRNGRQIETVGHILRELGGDVARNWVLDGEVMGASDFDESSGSIRRKSTGENRDIYYNVFDAVPAHRWAARQTDVLGVRKRELAELVIQSRSVRMVPWEVLGTNPSTEELFARRDALIAEGFEGAMLKNLDAPYEFKRGDNLLKLKDFKSVECRVVDLYEGKGKHRGRLGGIVVETDEVGPRGVQSRCGSGFSDQMRDELWRRRPVVVGRVVECQYQNLTADGCLRFPVFVKFRPDKE